MTQWALTDGLLITPELNLSEDTMTREEEEVSESGGKVQMEAILFFFNVIRPYIKVGKWNKHTKKITLAKTKFFVKARPLSKYRSSYLRNHSMYISVASAPATAATMAILVASGGFFTSSTLGANTSRFSSFSGLRWL